MVIFYGIHYNVMFSDRELTAFTKIVQNICGIQYVQSETHPIEAKE